MTVRQLFHNGACRENPLQTHYGNQTLAPVEIKFARFIEGISRDNLCAAAAAIRTRLC